MIKVLFIVPSLRRAGAESQIVDLVNAIDKTAFEVHLLAFEQDLAQLDRVDTNHVTFHHVLRQSKYDRAYIGGIAELIDRIGIEVVHCTMQFSMLVAWLACRRASRSPQLVAAIHTTLNRGLKEEAQDRLIYQWLLRRIAAVIFVCHNQAEYWYQRYPFLRDKSHVVYNGVDVSRYRPDPDSGQSLRARENIAADAFLVGCVAGFRSEKGHHLLIDAMQSVPQQVVLALAGGGETRPDIEAQVQRTGLSNRVHFLGNLSDVRPLLSACDLTVLSSTAVETFSIAMLESMAMGVPMLATDIGGLSEAIQPGKTGALVQPGSSSELADAMTKLHSQPEQVMAMGQAARALVEQQFSVNKMADDTAKLLIDVAGSSEHESR